MLTLQGTWVIKLAIADHRNTGLDGSIYLLKMKMAGLSFHRAYQSFTGCLVFADI